MLARTLDDPAGRANRAFGRRWWLICLVVLAAMIAGGPLLPHLAQGAAGRQASRSPAPVGSPAGPVAPATVPPLPKPATTSEAAPPDPFAGLGGAVLRLPGRVPAHGSRTFAYANGTGPVLGSSGRVRRFRVAVEKGSNEDVSAFAAQVQAILGDRRGWIGNGGVRFQRVPGAAAHDFTVYLATRDTAARMCRRGGVDIRVGGRPYTSCRATGQAIINLDRWRLSAATFTRARVPLATYRQYVVNHEVGHELGRHHEGCPKRGGPAPVMVQQTLTVRGCTPYAWPRHGRHRLVGPPR